MRNGHAVYSLKDAGAAVFRGDVSSNQSLVDPSEMAPPDRDKWFSSELKRLDLEREMKRLIPVDEMRKGISDVFKRIATTLDTMTDVIERDVGLNAEQIESMQRILRSQRESLFENIEVGE